MYVCCLLSTINTRFAVKYKKKKTKKLVIKLFCFFFFFFKAKKLFWTEIIHLVLQSGKDFSEIQHYGSHFPDIS